MTQVDIHPAVARQEDAALIAHYQNRNLILAQKVADQATIINRLQDALTELEAVIATMAAPNADEQPDDAVPEEA